MRPAKLVRRGVIRRFNVLPRELNELIRGRRAHSIGKLSQRIDRVQVGSVIGRAKIFVEGACNLDPLTHGGGFPRRGPPGGGGAEGDVRLGPPWGGREGGFSGGSVFLLPEVSPGRRVRTLFPRDLKGRAKAGVPFGRFRRCS